jgi:hypothetical protein
MDAADRQPERVQMRRRLTAEATRRTEAPMMSRLSMSPEGLRRVMFIPAPDGVAGWRKGSRFTDEKLAGIISSSERRLERIATDAAKRPLSEREAVACTTSPDDRERRLSADASAPHSRRQR